ncbi:MAG: hypothetical protein JXB03_05410, partial [Spirochaetales bacterium]|nr:hypothetical protein [Spirochaetales bacterium]
MHKAAPAETSDGGKIQKMPTAKPRKEKRQKHVEISKTVISGPDGQGKPRLLTIVLIHFFEILYSLFLIAWFYLSFFIPNLLVVNILSLPRELFGGEGQAVLYVIATIGVWVIPFLAVFKITGIFFKSNMPYFSDTSKLFSHGMNVVMSLVPLFFLTLQIALSARSISFFLGLSYYTYAVFGASITYNFLFILLLIRNINKKNATYHEYLG